VHPVNTPSDGPTPQRVLATLPQHHRRHPKGTLRVAHSLGFPVSPAGRHRLPFPHQRQLLESGHQRGGQVWLAGTRPQHFADSDRSFVEYQRLHVSE